MSFPVSISGRSVSRALAKFDETVLIHWEIDSNDIEWREELGRGAFGIVSKGVYRNKAIAVKVLSLKQLGESAVESFKREVAIMSMLHHPNVLLFIGASLETQRLLIVTEFMSNGTVNDLIRNPKLQSIITLQKRIDFAKQAALGMSYLHGRNPPFLHRDLKTHNLLVDEFYRVKVSDFGLAHLWDGESTSVGLVGTPLWMAPEVLLKIGFTEKADVYSFAIILWELLTLQYPNYGTTSLEQLIDHVGKKANRLPLPQGGSRRHKQLIERCWTQDPITRPSFDEIVIECDKIIIDVAIMDGKCREFWNTYFCPKEGVQQIVSWQDFVKQLYAFVNSYMPPENDVRITCLKKLLVDERTDKVSIETFGKMLMWFGPFTNAIEFSAAITDLLNKPWFFGDISTLAAEQRLIGQQTGTFLVRFSSSDPGCFAVSAVNEKGLITHYRILHRPGLKYLIEEQEYQTLNDLILSKSGPLKWLRICPGSPFAYLFQQITNQQTQFSAYAAV
eukprot:TRINITY_DN2089_c0_g1_i1.p1 TRINITY_DN2089_c0_g1~~TRINITY_DN2089_c0_g1_i1.p1  ORF type:complete len:504 (-),score=225.15 TRINITY_DN2089_c0_g1_i1:251-1762(-)